VKYDAVELSFGFDMTPDILSGSRRRGSRSYSRKDDSSPYRPELQAVSAEFCTP
jgi:hypothetical protein